MYTKFAVFFVILLIILFIIIQKKQHKIRNYDFISLLSKFDLRINEINIHTEQYEYLDFDDPLVKQKTEEAIGIGDMIMLYYPDLAENHPTFINSHRKLLKKAGLRV